MHEVEVSRDGDHGHGVTGDAAPVWDGNDEDGGCDGESWINWNCTSLLFRLNIQYFAENLIGCCSILNILTPSYPKWKIEFVYHLPEFWTVMGLCWVSPTHWPVCVTLGHPMHWPTSPTPTPHPCVTLGHLTPQLRPRRPKDAGQEWHNTKGWNMPPHWSRWVATFHISKGEHSISICEDLNVSSNLKKIFLENSCLHQSHAKDESWWYE